MSTSAIPFSGLPTGLAVLNNPALNKGTAFTETERDVLGLRGLLPPRICTQDDQVSRVLENFRHKTSALEKYIYLVSLQDRNESLFYRIVMDDPTTMLPLLYTPTVGEACQRFGHLYRRPRGIYITAEDRGCIARILANWPHRGVRVIVVTDGERILGLGDLGANGMGIPIGKLTLYTACGGVDPRFCLPITLDVGTENRALLTEPLYLGMPHRRVRGPDYDALIEEFMAAANSLFSGVLIQFEDFATRNAVRLLERYRNRYCCFNDDIQGTGAVALAGLMSASGLIDRPFSSQRFLFLGAGEAGIGIADMLVSEMAAAGLTLDEARERCWFVDSQGLVVANRGELGAHKRRYAHQHEPIRSLADAIEVLCPTALIGVSGQSGAFTRDILAAMARLNPRPIILALSNPTSKSECTAEEAYHATDGRAVFASGSPFAPVRVGGQVFVPGQCNNAYVFPGMGLGVVQCGARQVTDRMFSAAAHALVGMTTAEDLRSGHLFPGLDRIREVSVRIASAVIRAAHEENVASEPLPDDLDAAVQNWMYEPTYRKYVVDA